MPKNRAGTDDKARSLPKSERTTTIVGCVQADVVMTPVSALPPPGTTLLTEQTTIRVGGAGANSALAAVEAGMGVRLIGCVGDDQLGAWIRRELAAVGLADDLVVVPGEATGLTVALESSGRDRSFLTYLGVNDGWGATTIPDAALTCDSLLLCDYFLMPALRGKPAGWLLDTARRRGASTFFDTTWDPGGFSECARREVYDLLPSVDVFLPNEAEACTLAALPGDVARAAHALQGVSGGWVVVKLGASGCLAAGPGGTELRAAARAVAVADTTGAGDAFNAGLLRALAEGTGWQEALAAATRFATTIISRPSDQRYTRAALESRALA